MINADQEKMEALLREALAAAKAAVKTIIPNYDGPGHLLGGAVSVMVQAVVSIAEEDAAAGGGCRSERRAHRPRSWSRSHLSGA